jgi:predicted dehydrogenase
LKLISGAIATAAQGPLYAASRAKAIGFIFEPTGTHEDLLLKGVAKCAGISVIGIADATAGTFERARTMLGPYGAGLRTFTSYTEMLSQIGPQLTVISLEAYHNPEAVQAALQAGSHVMSEKPPCILLEQFEALAALAKSRNLQLMMAMATRANAGARKARELIQRGWLGKQYGVTMNWIADQTRWKSPQFQNSWMASKAKAGGGTLAFHGIHYLDLIQFMTGDRIERVSGFCRNVGGQPIETEDAAVLSLAFRRGMLGTLNTGYYLDRDYANSIHLWGEKGWVHFDPFGPLQWYSTHPDAPQGQQSSPNPGSDDDYDVMMAEAVESAFGNGPAFMTTEESASVIRVIFAGYRAAETGVAQTVA